MLVDNWVENLLLWGAILYFVPSLVALRNGRFGSVFVVNLFLGWTLVGWVAAFAWALAPIPAASSVQSSPFGFPVQKPQGNRVLTTVARSDADAADLLRGMPVALRRGESGQWSAFIETGLLGNLDDQTAKVVEFRSETLGKPRAKIVLVDDVGVDLEIEFPPQPA